MIRVLVDSREQAPWRFKAARRSVTKLGEGDYALYGDRAGLVIERKSVEDLFGTVTKGAARFERELGRLAKCLYPVVLVEGNVQRVVNGAYYSGANGWKVLDHILKLCVKHGVCLMFARDRAEACDLAERLLKARHEIKTGKV